MLNWSSELFLWIYTPVHVLFSKIYSWGNTLKKEILCVSMCENFFKIIVRKYNQPFHFLGRIFLHVLCFSVNKKKFIQFNLLYNQRFFTCQKRKFKAHQVAVSHLLLHWIYFHISHLFKFDLEVKWLYVSYSDHKWRE